MDKHVAILMDLCGPKIRTANIDPPGEELQIGDEITINASGDGGTPKSFGTNYEHFIDDVAVGHHVVLAFHPHLACSLGGGHRTGFHQVVVGDGLGTDEPALEIAVDLAGDKEETNGILRDLGLPVPEQRIVRQASDAKRAANLIGFPVVLKPLAGNHGRGVSINLRTPEEVEVAFDKASGAEVWRASGIARS